MKCPRPVEKAGRMRKLNGLSPAGPHSPAAHTDMQRGAPFGNGDRLCLRVHGHWGRLEHFLPGHAHVKLIASPVSESSYRTKFSFKKTKEFLNAYLVAQGKEG